MKKFVQSLIITVIATLGLVGPLAAFAAGPTVVNLLSLSTNNFVVFGKTGVTDATPASTAITGNVGTSLVANPAVTGLSCTELAGNSKIYILSTAGYPGGWDSNPACLLVDDVLVANADNDITTAYNDAASARIPTVVGLGGGTIASQTIVPGTYKWGTGVTITGDVTLAGGPNDVWIFQIAGNLDIQNGFKILLSGGAQAKNIFWAVAGNTTLFPGSTFEGNILGWSFIAMQAGATLNGRALSNTQVTLIGNTITAPTTATVVPVVKRRTFPVVPIIGLLKVPSPLSLPAGPGPVTYNYTVWNVGKVQQLIDITVVDDKCSPLVLSSGDINNNGKLDIDEKWNYRCTSTLTSNTTNTAIATAHSSDGYYNTAIATAISTVVVGTPVQAPLIHIVKVPNQLTPFPFGGGDVTYTYTVTNPGVVSMSNVVVTDDKCSAVSFSSGDNNGNNLLDVGESWIYTCKAKVQVSTGSVATAKGDANGFTALAYSFVNVLVSAPELPDTGLGIQGITFTWFDIILIITVVVLLSMVVKKDKK